MNVGDRVRFLETDARYPRLKATVVKEDSRGGARYLGVQIPAAEAYGIDHVVWRYETQLEPV